MFTKMSVHVGIVIAPCTPVCFVAPISIDTSMPSLVNMAVLFDPMSSSPMARRFLFASGNAVFICCS